MLPVVARVDATDEIEKCCLAAARRPGNGHEHAILNLQVDATESQYGLVTELVLLGDILDTNQHRVVTSRLAMDVRVVRYARAILCSQNTLALHYQGYSAMLGNACHGGTVSIDGNIRMTMLRLAAVWAALILAAVSAKVTWAAEPEQAERLVEQADQVRFPRESFQVDVIITSTAPDKEPERRKYRILSKGNDNTLVITLEPAADKGQVLLMRGRDLWIYLPNSLATGTASVVAAVDRPGRQRRPGAGKFRGRLHTALLGTETVDDAPCQVLDLDAVDRSVTYHRVKYWVREAGLRPQKAEFYSLSDRLLKVGHYRAFQALGGKVRPTEVLIEDALHQGEQSLLQYSNLQLKELPDKMFSKDYLKRLDY